MIDPAFIDEVKRRTNIAVVIGRYTSLRRSGKSLMGKCPFHQEKSPSFSVNESKGFYYCFGCQANGDALGFLQAMRGLSFYEALEDLAREAGLSMPEQSNDPQMREARDHRKRLAALNNVVSEFYHRVLLQSSLAEGARKYLESRELDPLAVAEFRIGYAPAANSTLVDFLRKKNLDLRLAEELGLIKQGNSGWYDVFRERLLFPIIDPRGTVIGFGGRDLTGESRAKYINSPESVLFKKGQTLFGLPQAVPAMGREETAVFVEGYVDLIALWQAGIHNVVAPLGTALTKDHLELVQRYAASVTFLFDGDAAGEAAAKRAVDTVLTVGIPARMVRLDEGLDPDDFVKRHGADEMRRRLAAAKPLVGYFLDQAWENTPNDAPGIAGWVREALDTVARLRDPYERGLYLKAIAERSNFNEANLRKQIAGRIVKQATRRPVNQGPGAEPEQLVRYPNEEVMVVKLLLHYPRLRKAFHEIQVIDKFSDPLLRKAASILVESEENAPDGVQEAASGLYGDEKMATLVRRLEAEGVDETPEHIAEHALFDSVRTILIRDLDEQVRQRKLQLLQEADHDRKLAVNGEVARLKLLREQLMRETKLAALSMVE